MKLKFGNRGIWFAGLLGAALITGSPLTAQAEDGKWWDPQGPRPDRDRRVEGEQRWGGRDGGSDRGGWSGRGGWGTRPRFQRESVVLRDGYYGRRYRANRVWIRPQYSYRRHVIVLHPVRYYVAGGFRIGGARFHARFHDCDGWYGCNFCDARFSDYDSYLDHVHECDARPSGFRIQVSNWDDDWDNDWNEDDCR